MSVLYDQYLFSFCLGTFEFVKNWKNLQTTNIFLQLIVIFAQSALKSVL